MKTRIAAPIATAWRVRTVAGSAPAARALDLLPAGAARRGRGDRRVGSSSSSKKDKKVAPGSPSSLMQSKQGPTAGPVRRLFAVPAEGPANARRIAPAVTITEERDALDASARPLVLRRYRLGRRLGAGGFGAVHEAFDERLERWVAVKVIPTDGPAPERARREAKAAARLDHPGIVALFDAGEEERARYLVSELVEGPTLAELEAAGALTDRDVLRIG